MPNLLLGNKRRQFKRLAVLQQYRLNRANDSLSAYQRDDHRTALLHVSDILKQGWSYLLFERRFLQDTRTFTQTFTKNQVVDRLLAALETYEKCLAHQAVDPSGVKYDLSDLESRLSIAIETLHTLGQSVKYEAVEIPKTSWKCTKEYEGWKANWRDMMDPLKGKLRLRERDVPEFGTLIDGGMTVTFCDEFGEETEEVPLTDTLPTELVVSFDQALERAGGVDWEVKAKPKIPKGKKGKKAAPSVVPQSRSEFVLRTKSAFDLGAKLEDETERLASMQLGRLENQIDTTGLVTPAGRPPVRLSIRRTKTSLV
ncbi:hypothetical protein MBLNU13_g11548t1 [Cladosporium sp. NU13]